MSEKKTEEYIQSDVKEITTAGLISVLLLIFIPVAYLITMALIGPEGGLQLALSTISNWAVPTLVLFIPIYAMFNGVKVYEVFVEGAKEGFEIGVKIMPYLVAILVAIGMLRDVTALEIFGEIIEPVTSIINMPAEILPMAIIRPLSGGGAIGVMNSILIEHGPDSYLGLMASVMMGSTETTFYVLAVYFGSVNIRKSRHALFAGLIGDAAGIMATIILCSLAFGDLLNQ